MPDTRRLTIDKIRKHLLNEQRIDTAAAIDDCPLRPVEFPFICNWSPHHFAWCYAGPYIRRAECIARPSITRSYSFRCSYHLMGSFFTHFHYTSSKSRPNPIRQRKSSNESINKKGKHLNFIYVNTKSEVVLALHRGQFSSTLDMIKVLSSSHCNCPCERHRNGNGIILVSKAYRV